MSWIQTYTRRRFDFAAFDQRSICLRDISHALSHICRFGGHCREFYSVAQHSVLVCERLAELGASPTVQLAGLLHDASEAYIGDITRPLKRTLRTSMGCRLGDLMPEISDFEDRIQQVIRDALMPFGCADMFDQWPDHLGKDLIKLADEELLATEARDLLDGGPDAWESLSAEPLPHRIESWTSLQAKCWFQLAYYRLVTAIGTKNVPPRSTMKVLA